MGFMVPGSTLRYGSSFWMVSLRPRASSKEPIDAEARPLPSDETTPPDTKMNLVFFDGPREDGRVIVHVLQRQARRARCTPDRSARREKSRVVAGLRLPTRKAILRISIRE